MSSPTPAPKDLRPDLIRRIESMADNELQFVHAVLLQAEKDRLWAEISAEAEEDRLAGVFERLPEVIGHVRRDLSRR
jgi:hypothetical protein